MPKPLVSISIVPKTPADAQRLLSGLRELMAEDPTLRVHQAPAGDIFTIDAMGERHLEIVIARLSGEFHVAATVGKLRPAYREVLTREAAGEGRWVQQIQGRGEYAHVKVRVHPGEEGSGYVFVNAIFGGAISGEFIQPIDEGIRDALTSRVIAGGTIDDVRVELYDGSYHDVDSSRHAFKAAAAIALRDAAQKAAPVLLEPVVRVEVRVPQDAASDVVADLTKRRAQVLSRGGDGTSQLITARAPVSRLFGYAGALEARTRGRGSYAVVPDGHERRHGDPDSDDGPDAPVRAPIAPAPPGGHSHIALPEPDDSGLEG